MIQVAVTFGTHDLNRCGGRPALELLLGKTVQRLSVVVPVDKKNKRHKCVLLLCVSCVRFERESERTRALLIPRNTNNNSNKKNRNRTHTYRESEQQTRTHATNKNVDRNSRSCIASFHTRQEHSHAPMSSSPANSTSPSMWNPFQHLPPAAFSSRNDTTAPQRRKRPDSATMQRRWNFREEMEHPTRRHIPHSFGGRNIAHILYDRERGKSRTTAPPFVPKPPSSGMPSPNSTTSRVYEQDDEHIHNDKRAILKQLHEQRARCTIYPTRIADEIAYFAEYLSTTKFQSSFMNHLGGNDVCDVHGQRPESSSAVSTISIAFSPDAQTMASTHGDHTVKIACCHTGRCLQTLEGHPRTPWTVKYHPTHATILASGCLGHQVRIWNWPKKVCLQMVRLDYAIISVSFHPTGSLLAIANGTRLHFWGLDPLEEDGVKEPTAAAAAADPSAPTSTRLTELDQRHMLRCVHFPPDGTTIIVGGVNPSNEDPRRRPRPLGSGGTMSFYLRLWDFDISMALQNPGTALRRAISHVRMMYMRDV